MLGSIAGGEQGRTALKPLTVGILKVFVNLIVNHIERVCAETQRDHTLDALDTLTLQFTSPPGMP